MSTFDGPNKLIVLDFGTTSITARALYREWKEYVLTEVGARFDEAFFTVGGNPVTANQNVAPYYFLNTTAGWRIRPQEADHTLVIDGNLLPVDPADPVFVPTLGAFTVDVQRTVSPQAIEVSGGGGGGSVNAQDVRDAMTLPPTLVPQGGSIDAKIQEGIELTILNRNR